MARAVTVEYIHDYETLNKVTYAHEDAGGFSASWSTTTGPR
jgi:hypothetical protein